MGGQDGVDGLDMGLMGPLECSVPWWEERGWLRPSARAWYFELDLASLAMIEPVSGEAYTDWTLGPGVQDNPEAMWGLCLHHSPSILLSKYTLACPMLPSLLWPWSIEPFPTPPFSAPRPQDSGRLPSFSLCSFLMYNIYLAQSLEK